MMVVNYGNLLKTNNIKVFQLEIKMENYLMLMVEAQIKERNLLFGKQMDKQIKLSD